MYMLMSRITYTHLHGNYDTLSIDHQQNTGTYFNTSINHNGHTCEMMGLYIITLFWRPKVGVL